MIVKNDRNISSGSEILFCTLEYKNKSETTFITPIDDLQIQLID